MNSSSFGLPLNAIDMNTFEFVVRHGNLGGSSGISEVTKAAEKALYRMWRAIPYTLATNP